MSSLRFDNKVALVTGAGAGLGKIYAVELARRGAKVVVNDLGVTMSGEGSNSRAADLVVNEIRAFGGEATANYDSVENGVKIVEETVQKYGKIDIIINNAGILRDLTMLKMTAKEWDIIISIHLKSSFMLCKAAWKHMRQNKYGRIINTSSPSGLYGNFGQSNYATAKLAVHGLTQTLSKEGENYNIRVNTIAPQATSRMTEDLLPKNVLALIGPEKVTPLVLYLCHEKNDQNGSLYEVCGGLVAKMRLQRTKGHLFYPNMTAEDVLANWRSISSFDENCDYPTSMVDTLQRTMGLIEKAKPKL